MALKVDIVTDGATARLVEVAKAAKLSGMVPLESGRALVSLATAVRGFIMAHEAGVAMSVLDDIVKSTAESEVADLFTRHADHVRKAVNFQNRK